jgi:hypothetical protein
MKQIFAALSRHAAERPKDIAFREPARSITWAELAREVGARAASLRPAVLGLGLSGIDYVIADLAATLAGCRVVPVPSFFSPAQIAHLLADAGAAGHRLPDPGAAPAAGLCRRGGAGDLYLGHDRAAQGGGAGGSAVATPRSAGLAAALRPGRGTAICRSCRRRNCWNRSAASSCPSLPGPRR